MRPLTVSLLLVNIAVFGAQHLWGDSLERFALWPPGFGFEPMQLVTYAFLHVSVQHLFFNMFALYMFGSSVEQYLGSTKFGVMYFASVITAAVTQVIVVSASAGPPVPTVGASGGVFGLLLAYGWLFPRNRITLLFPPIPMPAWLFVTLYGLVELVSGVLGTQSGVAHFAHLGGMVGAFVALVAWGRKPRTG